MQGIEPLISLGGCIDPFGYLLLNLLINLLLLGFGYLFVLIDLLQLQYEAFMQTVSEVGDQVLRYAERVLVSGSVDQGLSLSVDHVHHLQRLLDIEPLQDADKFCGV